jgi:hypothetical protein
MGFYQTNTRRVQFSLHFAAVIWLRPEWRRISKSKERRGSREFHLPKQKCVATVAAVEGMIAAGRIAAPVNEATVLELETTELIEYAALIAIVTE